MLILIYGTWRHNDIFVLLAELFQLQVSVIFFIPTQKLPFPLLNSDI